MRWASLPAALRRLLRTCAVAFGAGGSALVGAQTADTVTLDSVVQWALDEHPLATVADAVERRGPAALMAARGAFDPTLQGDFERKEYLGSDYFQYADVGVEWQTPWGVKLEAGRQWAEGIFINPEATVPSAGQAYIGVKLPVLQGLLADKYRTGVRQGEVDVERNRAAAAAVRNELLYDTHVAYLNWAYAARVYNVYEATEELLRDYLLNTRGLFAQGDKPAVDTLEARLYLVDQQLLTQQAFVDYRMAAADLRAFYFPLATADAPNVDFLVGTDLPAGEATVETNPELVALRAELSQLSLERRLKREYLKPRLDLGYSVLGDGFNLAPQDEKVDDRNLFTRAYKASASFRYPIPNRSARGQVQLADLKLVEARNKLDAKRVQLAQKLRGAAIGARAFDAQVGDAAALLRQAESLLEAERRLFDLGESTQFLLNARAQALQKALLTQAKVWLSRGKAILAYRFAANDWQ